MAQIIDKLCTYFGTEKTHQIVYIEDDFKTYRCGFEICSVDDATLHRGDILVPHASFMYKTFLDWSIPQGYNREEYVFGVPLPGNNNSYDSDYVDLMYDVIAPRLKQRFPGRPLFFENLWGKVWLCLMLNANRGGVMFINSLEIRTFFKYLQEALAIIPRY